MYYTRKIPFFLFPKFFWNVEIWMLWFKNLKILVTGGLKEVKILRFYKQIECIFKNIDIFLKNMKIIQKSMEIPLLSRWKN